MGGRKKQPRSGKECWQIAGILAGKYIPVFHIKHCSANPISKLAEGNIGNEFKDIVMPNERETIIKKNVNSAFIGTSLKEKLDDNHITEIVIVGLTTDHCVSTTVRMAGNYGYETFVVSDATATFSRRGVEGQLYSAELIHDIALASLNKEFATVVATEELIEILFKV